MKKDFNIWVNEINSVKLKVGRKNKFYYLDYKKYFNHNDDYFFLHQNYVKINLNLLKV